jgi:serine/threonine protein phosphatase PrpC
VLFEVQPDTALVPILVTLDQTCTASSQERARLQEQGARVLADSAGTLRVEGLTLVTRAIGDIALKRYLTAEPELYIQHLQPDREYILILATDGLWDVMDVGEVAKIIRGTVQVPGLLARRLVTEALQRETQDNVTVVAALLSTSAAKAPLLPPPGDAAREHA